MTLQHKFVELMPENLEEKILYISVKHDTCIHLCACGCGEEVVTPLDPTDWKFSYDGESVSLSPSIGNWDFPCRSHYWIRANRIEWAGQWTESEIRANKEFDIQEKELKWNEQPSEDDTHEKEPEGLWDKVKSWFRSNE